MLYSDGIAAEFQLRLGVRIIGSDVYLAAVDLLLRHHEAVPDDVVDDRRDQRTVLEPLGEATDLADRFRAEDRRRSPCASGAVAIAEPEVRRLLRRPVHARRQPPQLETIAVDIAFDSAANFPISVKGVAAELLHRADLKLERITKE